MKITLSESQAIRELAHVRNEFRERIEEGYEHRAMSCRSCLSPGACCTDAHFVNVRISRLEAVAIRRIIDKWPVIKRVAVEQRISDAIERYGLERSADAVDKTYSCPLYEKGTGCLVHDEAKPLPCIFHACYSSDSDLPPDEMLDAAEMSVDGLNRRTYGSAAPLLSIPLAVRY